jgi:hypothetical protein
MAAPAQTSAAVTAVEHWTGKAPDVRLFLWEKFQGSPDGKPAIVWVHGPSMASTPTFDLALPGHPSVMDWFAGLGYDCRTPSSGPAKAARPWRSGARSWPNGRPATGGPSTATSCAAFSAATANLPLGCCTTLVGGEGREKTSPS